MFVYLDIKEKMFKNNIIKHAKCSAFYDDKKNTIIEIKKLILIY